jgi:hypothetical protein
LFLCGPSKTNRVSSYALKHNVESWCRKNNESKYIANGAMIAAAHALDFPIKRPNQFGFFNALIGVKKSGLEKVLRPEPRPMRLRNERVV